MPYTNWNSAEPNCLMHGSEKQSCLAYQKIISEYGFDDYLCSLATPFVCQYTGDFVFNRCKLKI